MGHRFFFPTWPKEKECVSDGVICCYDSCDCDPANLVLIEKYALEFVRHLTIPTSKNNEGIRK